MKKITLSIPEHKLSFFMELIQSLGFVKIEETLDTEPTKEEVSDNIRQGLIDMKAIEKGTLHPKPAQAFLDE